MSATIIQADYETLEAIAARFEQNASRQEEALGRIRRQAGVLRESWRGEAATRFRAEMDGEIIPTYTRLVSALAEASATTREISRVLRQAEEEAAALFINEMMTTFRLPIAVPTPLDRWFYEQRADLGITHWEKPPAGAVLAVAGVGDEREGEAGDKYHPSDIAQGQIGDCYVASSIAAVVLQNPEWIESMITPNPDGTYTVRLFKRDADGTLQPVYVVVGPDFPVGRDGPAHLRFVDEGNGQYEYWAQLIEKAYAQEFAGSGDAYHGYNRLSAFGGLPGGVLEALTGQNSTTYLSSNIPGVNTFPSLEQLGTMIDQGYAITVGSRPVGWTGVYDDPAYQPSLITRHAYYVESVDVANGIVYVRNPWGYNEYPAMPMPYDDFAAAFLGMQVVPTHSTAAGLPHIQAPTLPTVVPLPKPTAPPSQPSPSPGDSSPSSPPPATVPMPPRPTAAPPLPPRSTPRPTD